MSWRRAGSVAVLLWCSAAGVLRADAETAWQAAVALEKTPATEFTSRAEAQRLALRQLDLQQTAYERVIADFPESPRAVDARLRLARIYLVRGDLAGEPALVERAFETLAELRADPSLPAERQADVAFADLSLRMQRAQRDLAKERDGLVQRAEKFRADFPGDRRIAPVFAGLAGIFEDKPVVQKRLLETAAPLARQEELQRQIADDLRRLAMLGRPVELEFTALDGRSVALDQYRGKVVVLCFFADLSPPSLISLARVAEVALNFPAHSVQCLGVSLDQSPEATRRTLEKFGIGFPVFCDGKGWESPLVRGLGINSLPTVWLIDRRGKLRMLNAPEDPAPAVKTLVRER